MTIWTDEITDYCAKLHREGLSSSAASTELNRRFNLLGAITRNSVIGKWTRMGLTHASRSRPKKGGRPKRLETPSMPKISEPLIPVEEFNERQRVERARQKKRKSATILDVDGCRYPLDNGLFCNGHQKDGSSYCLGHHKLCHAGLMIVPRKAMARNTRGGITGRF